MLSCGILARGYHHYTCSNPECTHSKNITHSCSCRYCQTCGVKPTNDWVNEQLEVLPNCDWQHIPPKGFKLIRYFRFLSNCIRGKLLPKIYKIFNQEPNPTAKTKWAELYKKIFYC